MDESTGAPEEAGASLFRRQGWGQGRRRRLRWGGPHRGLHGSVPSEVPGVVAAFGIPNGGPERASTGNHHPGVRHRQGTGVAGDGGPSEVTSEVGTGEEGTGGGGSENGARTRKGMAGGGEERGSSWDRSRRGQGAGAADLHPGRQAALQSAWLTGGMKNEEVRAGGRERPIPGQTSESWDRRHRRSLLGEALPTLPHHYLILHPLYRADWSLTTRMHVGRSVAHSIPQALVGRKARRYHLAAPASRPACASSSFMAAAGPLRIKFATGNAKKLAEV